MIRQDTRRILADAFVELLQKNSYESVSVSDIAAACGASRQTFYKYFHDKHDLAVWIARQDADVSMDCPGERPFWQMQLHYLHAMMKRREFYRKAFSAREQNSLLLTSLSDGVTYCAALIEQRQQRAPDERQQFLVKAMIYALAMMRIEWLRDGCTVSPEVFCERLAAMIPAEIRAFLDGTAP